MNGNITLMSAHKSMFKNFKDFKGRCRRKEYWLATAAYSIVSFVLVTLMYLCLAFYYDSYETIWAILTAVPAIIALVYSIAVIVPAIAMTVRRLHDTGKSAWFLLLGCIPYIGSIILFVFMVLDSKPGTNQYGPNPKSM